MVRDSSVEDIPSSHLVFSSTMPLLGFYLCLIFFVSRHLCGLFRYLCDPLSLSRDIFFSYLRIFSCFLFSLFLATMFLSCYLYSVYPISPNRPPPPNRIPLFNSVKCSVFMLAFLSGRGLAYAIKAL